MAADELHKAKAAVAQLVTCLVQTLDEGDPTFKDRFLKRLEAAYHEARDNGEGDQRHTFEMLNWTRELLTGFSLADGPGKPYLSSYDPHG